MAWKIAHASELPLEVVSIIAPVYFDGRSCGFFTCTNMWRHVGKIRKHDMSEPTLTAERF